MKKELEVSKSLLQRKIKEIDIKLLKLEILQLEIKVKEQLEKEKNCKHRDWQSIGGKWESTQLQQCMSCDMVQDGLTRVSSIEENSLKYKKEDLEKLKKECFFSFKKAISLQQRFIQKNA